MVSPEPVNQLNLLLWFLCRRPFIQLSVFPRAEMHALIFRIAVLDNAKFIHVVCCKNSRQLHHVILTASRC